LESKKSRDFVLVRQRNSSQIDRNRQKATVVYENCGSEKESMMLARFISLAALATVAGTQLMPSAAEAGMRLCFPFLICRDTPPSADGGYEGEEPEYIAPKKKTFKAAPASKPSGAVVGKKAVSSTGKKAASGATAISCDKAGEIVSGYGFTNVTPATCTGQVFAFNATRSGKTYVIKLSSASGELTEVKKVQ
jgi:hypothetical protein